MLDYLYYIYTYIIVTLTQFVYLLLICSEGDISWAMNPKCGMRYICYYFSTQFDLYC